MVNVEVMILDDLPGAFKERPVDLFLEHDESDESRVLGYLCMRDVAMLLDLERWMLNHPMLKKYREAKPAFSECGSTRSTFYIELTQLKRAIQDGFAESNDDADELLATFIDLVQERMGATEWTLVIPDAERPNRLRRKREREPTPEPELQLSSDEAAVAAPPATPRKTRRADVLFKELREYISQDHVEREALVRYQASAEFKARCNELIQAHMREQIPKVRRELRAAVDKEMDGYRHTERARIDDEMKRYRDAPPPPENAIPEHLLDTLMQKVGHE